MLSMLDGNHCDDEICCAFELSWSRLEAIVQLDSHHVVICK